jgi:methyltransferase-like protein
VLLPPTSTPRLDEPARRLAELVRENREACVYNAWHESVPLSSTDRHLLPLLDGSHDREALIGALLAATRAGLLQFERDGKPLSAEADIRDASAEHVDTLGERLTAMKFVAGS